MERFKQTIAKLEKDVAELKQFQQETRGSPPSKGDTHISTGSQEFGEYSLEELDTFRFTVLVNGFQSPNIPIYCYNLENPTPELSAYFGVQGKQFNVSNISVEPDAFEEYCTEKGGAPFVLTNEIRKCLESKLWEFAAAAPGKNNQRFAEVYAKYYEKLHSEFYTDITIPFKNTYKILPHISFYLTPINSSGIETCILYEITTKQVTFRIRYGNSVKHTPDNAKLHYKIEGITETENTLLD